MTAIIAVALAWLPRWLTLLLIAAGLYAFLLMLARVSFYRVGTVVIAHLTLLLLLSPLSAILAGIVTFASGICSYLIVVNGISKIYNLGFIVLIHSIICLVLYQTSLNLAIFGNSVLLTLNIASVYLKKWL
jgi:hypothetical protein